MKDYTKIIIYIAILIILIMFAKNQYGTLSEEQLINQTQKEISNVLEESETETQIASDFTVFDVDGNQVKLSDYFGEPIVINFWATWCGPCKSELPAFENLSKKYEGQVEFLMVNLTDGYSETIDGVKAFIKENEYTFPVYFDSDGIASSVYNISSIPETVFINESGEIVKTQIGAMSESVLESYIQNLLVKEDSSNNISE